MEENKNMTGEQLERELRILRGKERLAKAATYGAGALMILLFLTGLIPLAILFLILSFVFGYQLEKQSSAIKQMLADNVITSLLGEVFGDVVYQPFGRVASVGSEGMVFPFRYNKIQGSDHILGTYKGLKVELSDIELMNEEETTDADGNTSRREDTVFRGQWMICDFGKELSGEVRISGKTKKTYGIAISGNVRMENEQFNKKFFVNADDAQDAYYILTPHRMEYILSMAEKSGGTVYMSFLRSGKLHIAVQTGRDFFELENGKADPNSLRQKFLEELHWFTDIVDTLRIEE